MATLRILLRRSQEEGQEFSLETQLSGCWLFANGQLQRHEPPVRWVGHEVYTDDSISGDDGLGRAGLRKLIADTQPGDIVLCRDHGRLGRDAVESVVAIRDLVQFRRARLFYYAKGNEVPYESAIDVAMSFIQGVGAQMELENIRSRTKEALRARVRLGRSAGGLCFGYENRRLSEESCGTDREYTEVHVYEPQAAIVRRMFRLYLEGKGFKSIAFTLNQERILSPHAGRRGSGSWAPSSVRAVLKNPKYKGQYVHGRVLRKKQGGKRVARKADPKDVIAKPMPEWRIVDDETWDALQAIMDGRGAFTVSPGPAAKYALSGLARCSACGGSMGVC